MKKEFAEMIEKLDDRRFDRLVETLAATPPEVSIRLNPLKDGALSGMAGRSETAGEREDAVEWWPESGRYLDRRPAFTFDPAMHQGRYYVQDASSMIMGAVARFISRVVAGEMTAATAPAPPLLWLDACAAPGGKTTAALDGLPQGSLVVANEYDYQRAEILKENIAKWGNPSTVVTRGDTARFRTMRETFDVIAVDAPCSGEGMMRKDITARQQWTPALVEECASRQREILGNLWGALRPGGFLIYSTCTFNTVENEEMVRWMQAEYDAIPVDPAFGFNIDGAVSLPGDPAPLPAMRFIPGRIRGEGLFMAILRKPGELHPAYLENDTSGSPGKKDSHRKERRKGKNIPCGAAGNVSREMLETVRGWISDENIAVLPTEEGIRLFPRSWETLLPYMQKNLQVISAGVEAAEIKGKDIIPSQQLALSMWLRRGAFPEVDMTLQQAIGYLSRETVALPATTPKGFVLLTYESFPLGFVKNLGNRSNNLYPKEWRIKNAPIK